MWRWHYPRACFEWTLGGHPTVALLFRGTRSQCERAKCGPNGKVLCYCLLVSQLLNVSSCAGVKPLGYNTVDVDNKKMKVLLISNLVSCIFTVLLTIQMKKSRRISQTTRLRRTLQVFCCECVYPCDFPELRGCGENADFSDMGITGTLPSTIGLATQLVDIDLNENEFIGTIPTEIGRLTNLVYLGLELNDLSGPIPSEVGKLTVLTVLDLYQNKVRGTVPSEIGNMAQMKRFGIDENLLTGPIPTELGRLTNMRRLDPFDNAFSGRLPTEIGLLTKVTFLDAAINQFTGPVPTEIAALVNLNGLWIQDTQLVGSIPSALCNLGVQVFIDCDEVECNCCFDGDSDDMC